MSERSFCIFRRTHVRLTWASQVAYECFSFTAVPQTDLKYFTPESSLGNAWLTGKSTPTGLDTLPEAESHGYFRHTKGCLGMLKDTQNCLCEFWLTPNHTMVCLRAAQNAVFARVQLQGLRFVLAPIWMTFRGPCSQHIAKFLA